MFQVCHASNLLRGLAKNYLDNPNQTAERGEVRRSRNAAKLLARSISLNCAGSNNDYCSKSTPQVTLRKQSRDNILTSTAAGVAVARN